MAVNENVYGAANTWANAYYQQAQLTDKNKIANFGSNTYTLADGVSKGKLSYSDGIDKSISFCGLGTECALSHIGFIARTSNNTAEIVSTNERIQTNFGFFEMINNDLRMTADFRTNELYKFAWGNHSNLSNYNKKLRPLTQVNPHNFIFVIRVRAFKSNYSEFVDVDLKTYLSTHKTNYPKICCAYLVPYFGNATIGRLTEAGQGNPEQRIPLLIGLLDEYQFESKNLNFYSYEAMNLNSGAYSVVFGSFIARSYIYNIAESFNMIAYTKACENYINIDYQNDTYYTSISYFDGIEEEIIKTVACFGLYFTTNESIATRGALTHNDMYIGILNSQGIGRGEYLRGSETVNAPQNDYTDMNESGYDYTKPADPNSYSDKTNFSNFTNSILSSYAYYVAPLSLITGLLSPTLSALSEVASYPEPTNKWLFDSSFVFQEPIECILAWRKIFFKPATLNGGLHNISIGWFTTQNATSQAYISQLENERYLLADIEIYPRYGDFRDYEPYTTMALFVPYCGMKELPLATFMGHHMQLYLIKNYRTGALEILIMVDNKYWGNMTGNASIELPLSGNKSMEYIKSRMEIEQRIEDTMMNSFSSMVGNAAGATISLAHGNPAGALIQAGAGVLNAIQGVDQVAHLDYQLDHLANKIVNIQKGSTSTTPCEILYPYILIKRPRMMTGFDEDIYSKTIGYATLENKMKNSLKGYIEATSPLLDGIPCTDTERKLIVKALEEGCIFDEE